MDIAEANKIIADTDVQIAALEEEMNALVGKENKKKRSEKSKEVSTMKNGNDYVDAKRVVAGKDPIHRTAAAAAAPAPAADAAAAPEAAGEPEADEGEKKEKKEKKEKPKKAEATGLSHDERDELERLKKDIISRKTDLKAQGMSGSAINKEEQIAAWVARMNELKEKESPGSTTAKKDDKKPAKKKLNTDQQKELDELKNDIEEYRNQLITEFKYTKKDIAADPDMQDKQKRLVELEGSKKK